jgi:hypothetical protein
MTNENDTGKGDSPIFVDTKIGTVPKNEIVGERLLQDTLNVMQRRLRALTTAVLVLTLAVVLCAAAVYGNVANYFGGDWMLLGGVPAATAALGFAFGWFAGRKY